MSFGSHDAQLLASCILELHSLPFGPSFIDEILRVQRRLIPADGALFLLTDLEAQAVVTAATCPFPVDFERWLAAFDDHFWDYPLHQHHARIAAHQVVLLTEYGGREWRDSALVAELCRPLGLEHQLLLRLPTAATYVETMGVARGGADFSAREIALFEAFKEHLALAWAKAQVLVRPGEPAGAQALLPWRTETLVIDRGGRILVGSERGRRLLRTYFGEPAERDRLPLEMARWIEAQDRAPPSGDASGYEQRLLLRRQDRRLEIWLVPRTGGNGRDLYLRERPAGWHQAAT